MTDGGYILPRAINGNNIKNMTVIDVESSTPEKHTAAEMVSTARRAFNTGKTKSYEFRTQQLRNVKRFLKEVGPELCAALEADFRKPEQEIYILEIEVLIAEADHFISHLKDWMKPEKPEKPLLNIFDKIRIYSDPLGVVLVIGAWNYPVLLTIGPVLGAIAGGNCCIIKPSEVSLRTAQVMCNKLPHYLDQDCFPVFLGGIPETTDLLKQKFDYIFFTGSPQIGKIIHAAAAKNLTPCTLELGGKSPTYMDSSANIEIATRRILWGKFANCGQTCVAPDYLLCDKEVERKFLHYAEKIITEFFGADVKQSKDFPRIINERNFIRVVNLLKNQKKAIGGQIDAQDLFIHPTILVDVKPDDDIMQEEIFGPILPIITVNNPEEAIEFINAREKPLALYVFSNHTATKELFLSNTSSGGVCINDTIMHVGVETLPFGGVGNSGMGNYHGKRSFDTFVHKKSVLFKSFFSLGEKAQETRYPPYSKNKTDFTRFAIRSLSRSIKMPFVTHVIMFSLGVGVTIMTFYTYKYYKQRE
ncbi:aldehyde dehydrogenase, dimeric NADP-preferring-like isoform X2 [Sitophilus oryzae]|nr:aldehyde dehydrogenase, dimeric NADP-preferring-like isoform X2 [Sitophilus oryzae]